MKSSFGKNLKILREERKLTQNDLAQKLNVSWHTVSHWETGYTEPSLENVILIAEIFDVSTDDLLLGN